MRPNRCAQLLSESPAAESLVRRGLALLEANLRERALLGLADWECLGLASPELFAAIAALQRPSWGSWNGLLAALRAARRAVLRAGGAGDRDKMAQAADLQRILDGLEEEVAPGVAASLTPLAELTRTALGRRVKCGAALAAPIALRNLAAHSAPTDPDWWRRAAEALAPLLDWQSRQPAVLPDAPAALPSPWFLRDTVGGEVWAFNGLHGDDAVVYASAGGAGPRVLAEPVSEVLRSFSRLLGKEEQRQDNVKRLLARLAPEEVKGVLLGDYLVGRPVKQGGFGTVHVGVQLSTGRKVAVKILRDGMPEEVRARLHQEATFLSNLDHPNIVRVLGYGEDAWTPPRLISLTDEPWYPEFARSAPVKCYLVMEWIDGPTLEEVYQRGREGRTDDAALAGWFAQAADALAAVHAAGLIHRDVKPSNLMATPEGRLKLMDFGVARSQGEVRTLQTTPGHVLGTPAYMAPEQLRAADADAEVGPAADIYSLCASFYELFTGARLFGHDRETPLAVETRKLRGERPTPPRRAAPRLPWEIEAVLLGGLEPEVSDRYRSSADLKRDVDHFLRDEPIEYRRPSAARRLRLWYRRNPWVARLSTALAALLLLAAVGSGAAAVYFRDLSDQKGKALHDKDIALGDKDTALGKEKVAEQDEKVKGWKAQDLAVRGFTREGERSLASGDASGGLLWYTEALKGDRDPERAAEDPDYRAREEMHRVRLGTLLGQSPRLTQAWFHPRAVNYAAFSPDGRYVVTCCDDFTARVWDATTGRPVTAPLAHEDPVQYAAFSRDGRFIVTACGDPTGRRGRGEAQVWEVATGQAVTPPLRHPGLAKDSNIVRTAINARAPDYVITKVGVITYAAFRPDGRVVATASDEGTARLWDATTGAPVGKPMPHGDAVGYVEFSRDGKWLATAGKDGTARVWDAATGEPVTPPLKHGIAVYRAVFSPDGRTLATVALDRTLQMWDLTAANPTATALPLDGDGRDAAFSPDGRRLAVVDDSTVRVRQLASGEEVKISHPGARTAAFSPDGLRLVTAGDDVRVWDAAPGRPLSPPLSHGGGAAAFNADGRHLVTTEGDAAWVWELPVDPAFTPTGAGRSPRAQAVAVSPDGGRVAVAWGDSFEHGKYGAAQVWDSATGESVGGLMEHSGLIVDVAFSADGGRVATASDDGTARVWDARTGAAVGAPLPHGAAVRRVLFDPDGRVLATADADKRVRLWDLASGAARADPRAFETARRRRCTSARTGGGWPWSSTRDGTGRARCSYATPRRARPPLHPCRTRAL